MDITPAIPAGQQVIERYGAGRFQISGQRYEGSVLVFVERTVAWSVTHIDEVDADTLAPVFAAAADLDLLLLGCGPHLVPVESRLRRALRDLGVVVEPMDTGAACRTYNVLMAEGRRVAAALIAVE
ncbi:MAG: hypothetical protein D6826_08875 [Alphaproteobacteria bacterium]|nr:MAG: hypothetical protein D6826_08875 [Alphaproteobacteria bacterium]